MKGLIIMKQLKAFTEKAKSDQKLSEKLDALGAKGAGIDEYIELAAEYSFTVTKDELEKIEMTEELSEEELEEVSGGSNKTSGNCFFTPTGERKYIFAAERIKCNSFCGWDKWCCDCWGRPATCRDKWHMVELDNHKDYLAPINDTNHYKKHPPSYNT